MVHRMTSTALSLVAPVRWLVLCSWSGAGDAASQYSTNADSLLGTSRLGFFADRRKELGWSSMIVGQGRANRSEASRGHVVVEATVS